MSRWHELVAIVDAARNAPDSCVLATLVSASGSTFRRRGARLLIANQRVVAGAITGGCVEAELVRRAAEVLATRTGCRLFFRSGPEDEVFGSGSGCDGSLEVTLEPVTGDLLAGLRSATDGAEEDDWYAVIPPANPPITSILRGSYSAPASNAAEKQPCTFIERFEAPRTLTIFGATPTAAPLCALASIAGWNVQVADPRERLLTEERYPAAHRVIAAPAEALVESAAPPAGSAAVVMTHRLDQDEVLTRALLRRPLRFLGIVGAAARSRRIFERLGQAMPHWPHWVHSPAGLHLGGESPEQIALSIAAGIEAVFGRASAVPLRTLSSVHPERPPGEVLAAVLAAGASTRFEGSKLTTRHRGVPLVRRAIEGAWAGAVDRVLLVTGCHAPEIVRMAGASDFAIVHNDDWREGMASSIRAAVRCAIRLDASALLLTLADQPWMGSVHLRRLVAGGSARPGEIMATLYEEGAGVPALFPASAFESLLALRGDEGARTLLRDRRWRVHTVAGADVRDVDRPGDLRSPAESKRSASSVRRLAGSGFKGTTSVNPSWLRSPRSNQFPTGHQDLDRAYIFAAVASEAD